MLAYSDGQRGWKTATDNDVLDWRCYLDSQGRGRRGFTMRRVQKCGPRGGRRVRPLAESTDKGCISKLRMAIKETLGKAEDRDPTEKRGNRCFIPLVECYLTCVRNTQKLVGVPGKQATPLLTHDLARLLQDLRQRAQSAGSMSVRTEIARDIALFSLAFDSIRRG